MDKSNHPKQKRKVQSQITSSINLSILEKTENYLVKNRIIIILSLLLISLVLSVLTFDVKISIGHDDALYIESAHKWSKGFTDYFYTANAPLYVMFLILPIKIWGLNLIILKLFSVIFFLASIWFYFKAFEKRISYTVLFSSLFLTSINWFILSYASLTYTECFFMFITSIFFISYFRLIEKLEDKNWSIKSTINDWLILGFLLMILSISRNIAVVSFFAVMVYFLIRTQWKPALLTLFSFTIFRGLYEILRNLIWGKEALLSDQTEIILRKEAYNSSAGYEDFAGFINRFIGNSEIYLSGRLWEILGFKKENSEFSPILTLVVITFLIIALYLLIKKTEKFTLAAYLFSGAIIGATFFALQTSWGQGRFMMIHLPILLIVFFFLIRQWFKNIGYLYLLIFFIFSFVSINKTISSAKTNMKYLPKNLKGDLFAGYTDDWENYLKLSKWCGDSLPSNSKIACRKAPMSFVYASNLSFFPIYSVKSDNADTIYNILKKNKVTHVIFANLRLDPKQSGDVMSIPQNNMPSIFLAYQDQQQKSIINTIHNYFAPLAQRNPEMFQLIKVVGNDEEALLYKINY